MSYIWIKLIKNSMLCNIKKINMILQIAMTKINSILKTRRKEILFILKLVVPKISIININISYNLKAVIIYIILNSIYLSTKIKK